MDELTYSQEKPAAKMIFVAKIGDKAAFDKFLSFGVKEGMIIRNGNMLIPANKGVAETNESFAISIANDMLTFASDSATLVAYQSKTGKIGLTDEVKSKLKGTSVAAYFDVEKILNGISPNLFDSSSTSPKNILAKAKATFKNGWFTSDNFDGKAVTGKGELTFGDSKKNSLAQLVRFGMYAAEESKTERARYTDEQKEAITADVIAVEPVAPLPPVNKKNKK